MHIPPLAYFLAKGPYWITRFGEMGIVLPLAIALALWLEATTRSLRSALAWLLPLGFAIFITSLSKIAFLGWGVGIAALDFTGFSGHSMFAATTYPVLAYTLAVQWGRSARAPLWAAAAGYALALLIAWSRVHIQVHSWSEVIAGCSLGAAASMATIVYMHRNPPRAQPNSLRWVMLALLGWLTVMPLQAAPSRSHDMVTRLAITLAGRDQPYRRADMHAAARTVSVLTIAR